MKSMEVIAFKVTTLRAFLFGAVTGTVTLTVVLQVFNLAGPQCPECHCDCGQYLSLHQAGEQHARWSKDAEKHRVHYDQRYMESVAPPPPDKQEKDELAQQMLNIKANIAEQKELLVGERKDTHPLIRKSVFYNQDQMPRLPEEPVNPAAEEEKKRKEVEDERRIEKSPTKPPSYKEDYVHPLAPPRPRILCMIFTSYSNWGFKGVVVNNTWARRCDKAVFIYSSQENLGRYIPDAIDVNVPDGREHLTAKVNAAFETLYKKYGNNYDWYLKADDDTFYIMENLRYFLRRYNPKRPHYVGRTIFTHLDHGYNSGGAGYVLSQAAVHDLVNQGLRGSLNCSRSGTSVEDYDIAFCLSRLGIYPEDTTDADFRLRFHSDDPISLLQGSRRLVKAYRFEYAKLGYGNKKGDKMLSARTVSLHYINPAHMFVYDFFLYGLERCTWKYKICKTVQHIIGTA